MNTDQFNDIPETQIQCVRDVVVVKAAENAKQED